MFLKTALLFKVSFCPLYGPLFGDTWRFGSYLNVIVALIDGLATTFGDTSEVGLAVTIGEGLRVTLGVGLTEVIVAGDCFAVFAVESGAKLGFGDVTLEDERTEVLESQTEEGLGDSWAFLNILVIPLSRTR